jgi:hypothetical protein
MKYPAANINVEFDAPGKVVKVCFKFATPELAHNFYLEVSKNARTGKLMVHYEIVSVDGYSV